MAQVCALAPFSTRPVSRSWCRHRQNPTLACWDPPVTDFPEITANWFQSHLDFSGACHSLGPKPSSLEKPSLGEEEFWFPVCQWPQASARHMPVLWAPGQMLLGDLFRVLRAGLDRVPLPGLESLTLRESQW